MKKMIIAFLAIALSSTALFSQKNTAVKWGPKTKFNPKFGSPYIIGEDATGYYSYVRESEAGHYETPEILLEKYDKNLKLVSSNNVKLPRIEKKRPRFIEISYLDNQLIMFVSIIKKKKHKAYAQLLDKQGNAKGAPKLICTMNAFNAEYGGRYDVHYAADKTKLLLTGKEELYQDGKNSNIKLYYTVLDKNLRTIWDKALEFPFKKKTWKDREEHLANDGSLWLSLTTQVNKKAKSVVSVYQYKNEKLSKHKVGLTGKVVLSTNVTTNPHNNDAHISGIYANERKADAAGIYHTIIDAKTGKVKSNETKAFSDELIASARRNLNVHANIEIGKKDLDNLRIRNYLSRKSGGGYLVTEAFEISYSGTGTNIKTNYYYGPIMVFNILASGKIDWVKQIDRENAAASRWASFSSFGYMLDGKEENMQLFMNRPLKKNDPSNSEALHLVITSDGVVDGKVLFKNGQKNNHNMIFRPSNWYRKSVKGPEVIIYNFKKKSAVLYKGDYKFCKIKL